MNSYIVSFDKSNEDIPCLTIFRKNGFMFDERLEVLNVITGERAVEIWNELSKRANSEE